MFDERAFPRNRTMARQMPAHDRVVLLRRALRRRWPQLLLGYAPRTRSRSPAVGGDETGRGALR